MSALVLCPKCSGSLPETLWNQSDLQACPGCESSLKIEVFPALLRQANQGKPGERVVAESEAGCFFHPQKKAVLSCENCGRFVCALCDMEMEGTHLCPACLESGARKGRIKSLQNEQMRYDKLAFALVFYPVALLVFFWFTIFTAPAAIFIVIRFWNAPMGLMQKGRGYLWAALIIGIIEIMAWIVILIYFLRQIN